jgi:hypothetical protein
MNRPLNFLSSMSLTSSQHNNNNNNNSGDGDGSNSKHDNSNHNSTQEERRMTERSTCGETDEQEAAQERRRGRRKWRNRKNDRSNSARRKKSARSTRSSTQKRRAETRTDGDSTTTKRRTRSSAGEEEEEQSPTEALTDNDEQAVSCFLKALGMLKKLFIEEQGNEDDVSLSQTILHSSTHSVSHVQENHLFLFNCIICFKQQRWCDEASPRTADYHIYCAAIIINVPTL